MNACRRHFLIRDRTRIIRSGRFQIAAFWLSVGLALVGQPLSTIADEPPFPIRCHVWGRFEIGAWCRTTVDIETYQRGERLARTEREETRILSTKDDQGYELVVESSDSFPWQSERRVDRSRVSRAFPWFVARDRLIGPVAGMGVDFETFGETLHCRSFEYQIESEGRVTSFVDIFHAERFPYFLHRVGATASQRPDREVEFRTTTSISNNDVAIDLGDRIVSGVETRTVVERLGRTTEVIELLAAEVPGGLVSKRTTERDVTDQVVRREVIDLIDFAGEGALPASSEVGEVLGADSASTVRQGTLWRRWSRIQANRGKRE